MPLLLFRQHRLTGMQRRVHKGAARSRLTPPPFRHRSRHFPRKVPGDALPSPALHHRHRRESRYTSHPLLSPPHFACVFCYPVAEKKEEEEYVAVDAISRCNKRRTTLNKNSRSFSVQRATPPPPTEGEERHSTLLVLTNMVAREN